MQSYPSLPPQPFPPEVHQLSAHYSPLICLLLHSFTFLPSFLLILWFPLFPLHFPIIITSVIALPLPSGGVFTSASPSNPPFLDYYRMITATIPSWSLLHFTWRCSTLLEQIEMLSSNLSLIKTWEENSQNRNHIFTNDLFLSRTSPILVLFPLFFQICVILIIITIMICTTLCSCLSFHCLHISPFQHFEEFWFAVMPSLHCHYHNNNYDRSR